MAPRLPVIALTLLMAGFAAPSGAAAHDIGGDISDLVGTLMPAVVNIASIKNEPAPATGSQGAGVRRSKVLGSGFIIDPAGLVVTNKHVIEGAREVTVTLEDNLTYAATIMAQAQQADLAILKIQSDHPFPALHWGDSDKVRVGESVLAIGNPLGVGESVSAGIVSALNRDIRDTPFDDYIQTDAAINHGNSGGPLFNLNGEVIGINTALYSNVPQGGSIGLGFSIPANDARFVVDQLLKYGRVRPGWLGIRTQQVTPEIADALGLRRPEGAIVTGIEPEGGAAQADLETGDAILAFNDIRIRDIRQLARESGRAPLGSTAQLALWRDGKSMQTTVKITEMPIFAPVPSSSAAAAAAASPGYDLGLRLAPATPEARALYKLADDQAGLVVLDVDPSGAASDTGIAEGDVITRVQQTKVSSPNDLAKTVALLRVQNRRFALLLVVNKDGSKWIPLPLQ